jgi:hypothetical protein
MASTSLITGKEIDVDSVTTLTSILTLVSAYEPPPN